MAPKKKLPKKRDEFEVERIVGDKYVGGKRFFFIKWKDFNTSENTWEPEDNLGKCSSLIREYFNGKGLRNSKSHTLSTALLRSIRVSKQRRSSISSLISISSPKSSRKLIVKIESMDVNNIFTKEDNPNANKQLGKSVASSVLDKYSPRVQLVRIDSPETLPKSSLVPRVSSWTSTDFHDSIETVSSLPDINESNSREKIESQASSLDADRTEQNSLPTNSNVDSTECRSTSLELEPNSDQLPRPEVLSAPPVLDEDYDEIEDSDEELLTMRIFENINDEEKSTKRGLSKKRKRQKY